jgi:uncharacterized membrane protein YbhN (UPF0104 family)
MAIVISSVVFTTSAWYISKTFQWRALGQVIRDVDLVCLIVGGGISIMVYWMLRTLRWYILLRRTDTHVPFLDLYLCTAVSLSFALFTPLQSGEILKVELLKKYGLLKRTPGYSSFLVEKVLDLVVLVTMACVSLLTVLNILPTRGYACVILAFLVLVCISGLIVLAKLRLRGRPKQLLDAMRQCVGESSALLLIVVITCASWAAVAVSWKVLLYAGGIHLDFAKVVALMSVVAIISILSLIPGGVGISEAGSSQLLMRFGLAASVAQAGALVIRSGDALSIALGICHLGLLKLIRIRRRQRLNNTGFLVKSST